ncbi:MAG: SRPBCC family protein [Saprospiraceae bacterium]|nr:SRPBCC family protein [Saprospiraceae bacterium]
MKVLKYLLYIVLGIGALWLILSLFAKKSYRIERSMEIEAPRETVYEQVRLFKNITNWSPWHFMDPEMKTSIEGPDGELGTVYKWNSTNKNVGTGYQKIVSVKPDRLDYEIDFGLGRSPAYFLVEGDSQKTKITWVLDMHLPFLMRAGGMLTDINAYVGKDYGNGLANLKKYCEALNPKEYRGYVVKETERPVTYYAGVREVVDLQNIPQFFGENFEKAILESEKAGAKMTGPPCGFFWSFDTVAMKTEMAAAIPLDKLVKTANDVEIFSIGGKALLVEYFGDYALTSVAHGAIEEYMEEKKLQSIPPAMEEYITDPGQEPDTAKWLTRIIYFVTEKLDSSSIKK